MANADDLDLLAFRATLEEATRPGGPWTKRSLSLAAGLGPDAVRDILSGKSKQPSLRTVASISGVLRKSLLDYVSPEAFARDVDTRGPATLGLAGKIEAGAWREPRLSDEQSPVVITEDLLPEHPISRRRAFEVVDDSADLVVPRGTFVDCLMVDRSVRRPSIGDMLVVRRTRAGLSELTMQRAVMRSDGTVELVPQSSRADPRQQPIQMTPAQLDAGGSEEASIVAIVVGAYRRFDPPAA